MHASAATALAAVAHANVSLCAHWLDFSFRSVEHVHRLNLTAFEAFYERPLAAAQGVAMKTAAAALRDFGGEMTGPLAGGAELLNLLSSGLPGLVAQYAGDLSPVARGRRSAG